MTPEQATFLINIYLPQAENEQKTTRRVIAAVPADRCAYSPDPKSMTAWTLAKHIASSEIFFLHAVSNGAFNPADGAVPDSVTTPAQLVEWYDENFAKAAAKIRALTPEQLAQKIDFHGVFVFPAVAFVGLNCNHVIHHRGQLSAYLRPMGAKVPKIYGGSADEPMEMPAGA
ncbi:MAG TPA: DinB family protein [Bryobacteraceae bacterium]|nr:DinB family protein [Bryobacteraceae bacterium]